MVDYWVSQVGTGTDALPLIAQVVLEKDQGQGFKISVEDLDRVDVNSNLAELLAVSNLNPLNEFFKSCCPKMPTTWISLEFFTSRCLHFFI